MKNSLKVTIGSTMNKSNIKYSLLTQISAQNSFFKSKFQNIENFSVFFRFFYRP